MAYGFRKTDIEEMTRYGYFPSGLPPFISAASFATYLTTPANFTGLADAPGRHASSPTPFTFPKNYRTRRTGKLLNPIAHAKLLKVLQTHTRLIDAQLARSTLSLSRPVLFSSKADNVPYSDHSARRCYEPEQRHPRVQERRLDYSLRKRYLLKLDLSNFYSTLYIHAVTWAMCGKAQGKAMWRGGSKTAEYNFAQQLETALRNGQDQETRGVPMGHDAAFITAELVLCGLDSEIQAQLEIGPKVTGFRSVDDYEFFFDTRLAAEQALETLRTLFEDVGLHLNEEKLQLLEFPFEMDEAWRDDLANFMLPTTPEEYDTFLRRLIKAATRYRMQDANDKAVKYCLQILRPHVGKANVDNYDPLKNGKAKWIEFERTVAYLLKLDYKNINVVVDILNYIQREHGYRAAPNVLDVVLSEADAIKSTSCYEIAWTCWLLREYWTDAQGRPGALDVVQRLLHRAVKDGSCIAALSTLWLVHDLALFDATLTARMKRALRLRLGWKSSDSTQQRRAAVETQLLGPDWLLMYTACAKGWLGFDVHHLPEPYRAMVQGGVHFVALPATPSSADSTFGFSALGVGGFSSLAYSS